MLTYNNTTQRTQTESLEDILEGWCNEILGMSFEVCLHMTIHQSPSCTDTLQDPQIRKRRLQLLVYFSTTALKHNADFMLKVLEHILVTWPALEPEHRAFNDAIKDLQGESMVELQRLASEMPDHLLVGPLQMLRRLVTNTTRGCMSKSRTGSMK